MLEFRPRFCLLPTSRVSILHSAHQAVAGHDLPVMSLMVTASLRSLQTASQKAMCAVLLWSHADDCGRREQFKFLLVLVGCRVLPMHRAGHWKDGP